MEKQILKYGLHAEQDGQVVLMHSTFRTFYQSFYTHSRAYTTKAMAKLSKAAFRSISL